MVPNRMTTLQSVIKEGPRQLLVRHKRWWSWRRSHCVTVILADASFACAHQSYTAWQWIQTIHAAAFVDSAKQLRVAWWAVTTVIVECATVAAAYSEALKAAASKRPRPIMACAPHTVGVLIIIGRWHHRRQDAGTGDKTMHLVQWPARTIVLPRVIAQTLARPYADFVVSATKRAWWSTRRSQWLTRAQCSGSSSSRPLRCS